MRLLLSCLFLCISLIISAQVVVDLGGDTTICQGSSLILDAANVGATYTWNTGENTQIISVDTAGTYWVDVTDGGMTVRGRIRVDVLDTAVYSAQDTTICGGTQHLTIQNWNREGVLFWYDDWTGTIALNAGEEFELELYDTTTFYIEGRGVLGKHYEGLVDNNQVQGRYSTYYDFRGTYLNIFNIKKSALLDSLSLYIDEDTMYTTLQIVNPSGITLYEEFLTLTPGINRLNIATYLEAGNNYKIILNDLHGEGKIFVDGPSPFPLGGDHLEILRGVPFRGNNFFYNWAFRTLACPSARQPFQVNVLPAANINWPEDTIGCNGNLSLDVSFPNATYLWGDGSTASSLNITNSEMVGVTVSTNVCSSSENIKVTILDSISFTTEDTTTCGGTQFLAVQNWNEEGVLLWYDNLVGGTALNTGEEFELELYDTTTFYIEGRGVLDKHYEGLIDNNQVLGRYSTYYPFQGTYLNIFNIKKSALLDSLSLYIDEDTMYTTLQIVNPSGITLYEEFLALAPGINRLNIATYLEAGNNYKIILNDLHGEGKIFVDGPSPFPLGGDHLEILRGVPFRGNNFFYNWAFRTLACPTARVPLQVNILPTANINWPEDTIVCATDITLDVTEPNALYSWNTGETTSSISVAQNDTIAVTVTIGNCASTDTIETILAVPPSNISVSADTTFCGGNLTLYANGDAQIFNWYDQASATTPIAIGDSVDLNITDSTTIYVEGGGLIVDGEVYGQAVVPMNRGQYEDIKNSNYTTRGLQFDVFNTLRLDQVSIFTDTAFAGRIVLKNQYGVEIASQDIIVNSGGEHIISLDWIILEGANYQVIMDNVLYGTIYTISNYNFPLTYNDFKIDLALPLALGNQYNSFYKWKISTPSCVTNRIPVQINVPESPQLIIPSDTVLCNAPTGIDLFATGSGSNNSTYTYQWSTGETTDSIFVNNSGIYSVTATANGECSVTAEVDVQFLTTPNSSITAYDTTLCTSSETVLLSPASDGLLIWSELSNSRRDIVHLGASYHTYIKDSSIYELSIAAKATARLGDLTHPNPSNNNEYQSFIIPSTFNVTSPVILDSVAIYLAQAPTTFDIVLRDEYNQELQRKTVTVHTAREKVFIPIDFVILPANNYSLEFANINTEFLVNTNTSYVPSVTAGVVLTGTNFLGVVYNCFYDWNFSYALENCMAATVDTFNVNVVLPQYLPDSIHICDETTLDATNGGAISYQWSTADTTSSILVNDAGYYVVTMTDGGSCQAVDSVRVEKPEPLRLPNTTVLCGTELGIEYDSTLIDAFLWSTGDRTATVTILSTGQYSVSITTIDGCILSDTTVVHQFENPPAVNLGTILSLCGADTLDAGFGGLGMSYSWSTGDTRQTIIVDSSGTYAVTVTTPNGCAGSDNVYVDVDDNPTASFSYTISNRAIALLNASQNTEAYFWNFGDDVYTTFVQPFHVFAADGCYPVTLIASNNCGADTSVQYIAVNTDPRQCDSSTVDVVKLTENSSLKASIFPNPNNGVFHINFVKPVNHLKRFALYSVQGQLVWEQVLDAYNINNYTIRVPHLPSGMYYLNCLTTEGVLKLPLIVYQH